MFNHIYIYIHVYTCVCVCVWLAIYDRLSLSSVWVHAFDNQTSSAGSGASTTVTVTSTSAPRSLSWDPRVWGGSPKKPGQDWPCQNAEPLAIAHHQKGMDSGKISGKPSSGFGWKGGVAPIKFAISVGQADLGYPVLGQPALDKKPIAHTRDLLGHFSTKSSK